MIPCYFVIDLCAGWTKYYTFSSSKVCVRHKSGAIEDRYWPDGYGHYLVGAYAVQTVRGSPVISLTRTKQPRRVPTQLPQIFSRTTSSRSMNWAEMKGTCMKRERHVRLLEAWKFPVIRVLIIHCKVKSSRQRNLLSRCFAVCGLIFLTLFA